MRDFAGPVAAVAPGPFGGSPASPDGEIWVVRNIFIVRVIQISRVIEVIRGIRVTRCIRFIGRYSAFR